MSGTDDEPLVGGYHGRMLFVLSLGSFVGVAGRLVIPAVLPTIIEDFAISPSTAGVALTVMVLGIAVTQYVGGRLSDGLSRKTVLVGALGCFVGGFLVLAVAPSYGVFLVGAAVVGFGQGFYLPALFTQLSDLFVARRGRAFGVNNAAFALGSAVAPGLGVLALAVGPWRAAFLPVIGLLLVTTGLLHRWHRGSYVLGQVGLDPRATVRRLVGAPALRRGLVAFALTGFIWQAGVNFVPTFLQVERGIDPTVAGAAFAGLFLAGMVATPVAGNAGDRLGYPTVGAAGLLVGLTGLGCFTLVPSVPAAIGGVVLFGAGVSAFWPVMNAYVMDRFPEGTAGGDFGALNTVTLGAGSLGPSYMGFVAERIGYVPGFLGLSVPFLAAVATLLALRRLSPDQ